LIVHDGRNEMETVFLIDREIGVTEKNCKK